MNNELPQELAWLFYGVLAFVPIALAAVFLGGEAWTVAVHFAFLMFIVTFPWWGTRRFKRERDELRKREAETHAAMRSLFWNVYTDMQNDRKNNL